MKWGCSFWEFVIIFVLLCVIAFELIGILYGGVP